MTTQMNYFKKANILQILVLSLVLNSCGKSETDSDIKDSELPENVLPRMRPLTNEPILSESYVTSTRQKIAHFYNKNWPGKSANGAFLVAKNGQIVLKNTMVWLILAKKIVLHLRLHCILLP